MEGDGGGEAELLTVHEGFYCLTGPRAPTTTLHVMLTEDMSTVHFSGII